MNTEMKTIKGDLIELTLQGRFDVIFHCANCFCCMGSGIAPQIAKAFPCARDADDATVAGDLDKLGRYSWGKDEVTGVIIVNIYGQYKYGGPQDFEYSAIQSALRLLREDGWMEQGYRWGFPAIGCGLAGGDWDIVSKVINNEMPDQNRTFVEYEA